MLRLHSEVDVDIGVGIRCDWEIEQILFAERLRAGRLHGMLEPLSKPEWRWAKSIDADLYHHTEGRVGRKSLC